MKNQILITTVKEDFYFYLLQYLEQNNNIIL